MKDSIATVVEVVYWLGVIALWASAILLIYDYQMEGRYDDGAIVVGSVIGLHLLMRWALRISKIKKARKNPTSSTDDKKPSTWGV